MAMPEGRRSDGVPFPPGFFDRMDPTDDRDFYAQPRLVTHIDEGAIEAVGELYEELGVTGSVLDLMSSWVSHFRRPPAELLVLGLNAAELAANSAADERIVHDLNTDSRLPLPDDRVDDLVCCVSIDYLVAPVAVLTDARRVVRSGGRAVITFSNRCFPTKAIRGWLACGEEERARLVELFLLRSGWVDPVVDVRVPAGRGRDPLVAVWAVNP